MDAKFLIEWQKNFYVTLFNGHAARFVSGKKITIVVETVGNTFQSVKQSSVSLLPAIMKSLFIAGDNRAIL